MRASIERDEQEPQEPSHKRIRVSEDPAEAGSLKRPRLDHAYLSKICQPISPTSRDKHYKAWLANAGRSRSSNSSISPHPTPDIITDLDIRSFSRAPTPIAASSQESTATFHHLDYRRQLENYNIFVEQQCPPPGLLQEAKKIVFRQRDSPGLEDTRIDTLKKTMREIQNEGEYNFSVKIGAHIVPQYNHFTRFPFAVMNFKSQAEGGTIFAATSEAAGAGAVALNGFLELLARGPGMDADAFDFNKPLFFSVTMDLKSAQINVHWIEKTPKKNEYTFHLEELTMLPLGDGDSIQVLRRALKNIQDYAIEHLLPLIVDALDEYGNNWTKEREKDMAKQQADAEPPAPPSPPKPPRSKRTRSAAAKATKEATEARLPSQQDKHMPAEAHRPGVRTRRTARLDQSPNEDTARKWTSLSV
ncbi:hypothetical protein Q9189_005533 [Teloschistes chrysophthalmus]